MTHKSKTNSTGLPGLEDTLVGLQLLEEVGVWVDAGTLAFDKLQCLAKLPALLLHHVGDNLKGK